MQRRDPGKGPKINDPRVDEFFRVNELDDGFVTIMTTGNVTQHPDGSIVGEQRAAAALDRAAVHAILDEWFDHLSPVNPANLVGLSAPGVQ